jgi:ribosomal protein L12E/L44/L45/RPP1/RPP2
MTPVTAPTDASIEIALAKLAARDGKASALILDMAWIIQDQVEVSAIIRWLGIRGVRPHVFLVAASSRPPPESATRWVRSLGAHAILPRLSEAGEPSVEHAIGAVLESVGAAPLDSAQLKSHLRAFEGNRLDQAPASIVRKLTARDAATVAEELAAGVEIADRLHGVKRYPQCFVGNQGVAWLAAQYDIERSAAVSVGRALVRLGYVHHVLKEHDFENDHLFYRVAPAGRYQEVEPPAVIRLLRQADGLIADRTWRAASYPSCFVGQQAVDLLCSHYRLSRAEATALGQSLADLGIVRHVTGEHEFKDGLFYFRFLADERSLDAVER